MFKYKKPIYSPCQIRQTDLVPIDTVIVYREGDIVKQPKKKGSFVPKNVPGVRWSGSCRGGVGHVGVGWGGVGHVGVGWVM